MKVLDRYSVVLHIFRCNAKTKEAKLQISLAEIPLLRYSSHVKIPLILSSSGLKNLDVLGRSRLKNEMANLDQQGGGSRYIGGSGNKPL